MLIFGCIFIATLILISIISTFLLKRNSKLFWIPGAVLTGISFLVAAVSFFTLNGWDSMAIFFIFLSITFGSLFGTLASVIFSTENDNH